MLIGPQQPPTALACTPALARVLTLRINLLLALSLGDFALSDGVLATGTLTK